MQFNSFTSLIVIALSMGFTNAAAASPDVVEPVPLNDAGASCGEFQIVPNTADITASCGNGNGGFDTTRISLGNCVGNQNGNLGCQVGGGAGASCVFFNLFQSGSNVFISAHCGTADGGSKETDGFNLNNCLTNNFGTLTC